MSRYARGIAALILPIGFAACTPRVTIADARHAAADAQALMTQAVELQRAGKDQQAAEAGRRAEAQLHAARDEYLSARADLSDDPEVLIEFAKFVEKLEDYDLAGEAYLRAAGIRNDVARLWYSAARNFVEAGGRYLSRATEPLDRAESLARSKPGVVTQAEIETLRGDISWKNGAYDIASKKYAAALAADASAVRAKIGAVCAALALGDPVQAETSIEQMGEVTPADESLLIPRLREAYFAFRRGKPKFAETAANYRALAGLCVRAGIIGEARSTIERALTLDDKDVYSWNMAGSLAEASGNVEEARRAYMRSLELKPDQPRTVESLKALPAPSGAQPK